MRRSSLIFAKCRPPNHRLAIFGRAAAATRRFHTHLDSCRTACSPDAATPLQPSPPSALRSPPTARQTSPLAPASNARGRACHDAPPRLSARRRVLHSHSPPRPPQPISPLTPPRRPRLLAAHASLQPATGRASLHLPPRLSAPRRRACTRRRLSAQAAQASTRRSLATVLCRLYSQVQYRVSRTGSRVVNDGVRYHCIPPL